MIVKAKSPRAQLALDLVQSLQSYFRDQLTPLAAAGAFAPITWFRDEGRHGGGIRLTYQNGTAFNRASLNTSQVHYDDLPERSLGSANALSCIVHPAHPLWPSLHLHISWTEMKTGLGSWRLMADLNPSIPDDDDRQRFVAAMRSAAGAYFEDGTRQGDQYFHIPTLKRHRGVAHFYLEQHRTEDEAVDRQFAEAFGRAMIAVYAGILKDKVAGTMAPDSEQRRRQLDYHTVYLFQVLTLDRGTTSGLLVHDQNDLGILGSLPARVDRKLLASWKPLMPKPQDLLLDAIVAALPADGRVDDGEKIALCNAVRRHYQAHPEALDLQAKGDIVPPTVQSHGVTHH